MFNKWQAQRWWAENSKNVIELYNVQRFNLGSIPLPSPRSEGNATNSNAPTPSLGSELLLRPTGTGLEYSSDSADLQATHSRPNCNISSTPELSSSTSGTKTETSSLDFSISTRPSQDADHSGETLLSDADVENEWIEEDKPGVHLTIRALPGGRRELRRVRFRLVP